MATAFTIPSNIAKRIKTFSTGLVTNDVIYTCPVNTFTDVYLSDIYVSAGLNLTSIVLNRAGGVAPVSKTVVPAAVLAGPAGTSLTFSAAPAATDAFFNAIGGNVIRLFPNDFLTANYNGNTGTASLQYSTIEVEGQ